MGAELIETPAKESIAGACAKAEDIRRETGAFLVGQFTNPLNPEIHYLTTGKEIWEQMDGRVDAFVAGVGSGGTITGVGRFLKEHNPNARIVAVEPKNSAALLGHEPGFHQIQGIGDGFIPPVLDVELIDEVITVSDEDAISHHSQPGVGAGRAGGNIIGRECLGRDEARRGTRPRKPGGDRPAGQGREVLQHESALG